MSLISFLSLLITAWRELFEPLEELEALRELCGEGRGDGIVCEQEEKTFFNQNRFLFRKLPGFYNKFLAFFDYVFGLNELTSHLLITARWLTRVAADRRLFRIEAGRRFAHQRGT
jgi:hypothetical protein